MIPLQTIRGAVICFDTFKQDGKDCVAISAWRNGLCLATEVKEDVENAEDFWKNPWGKLERQGECGDMVNTVLALAEEQGMISKERQKGYQPFELLAEFIYLDECGYLRWCPRSEAMRKDANYFRYEKFDEFVNRNFAHAIVAAPEFTFMGETYQYQELHDFLKEKWRKHRENSTRNSRPAE